MTDSDNSQKVFDALKQAEQAPPQQALPMLNGLAGLIHGGGEQPMEVEDARASAFLAQYEQTLAGEGVPAPSRPEQAWAGLARVLLASNEFLYVD